MTKYPREVAKVWGLRRNFFIEEIKKACGQEGKVLIPEVERWLMAKIELSPPRRRRRSAHEWAEATSGMGEAAVRLSVVRLSVAEYGKTLSEEDTNRLCWWVKGSKNEEINIFVELLIRRYFRRVNRLLFCMRFRISPDSLYCDFTEDCSFAQEKIYIGMDAPAIRLMLSHSPLLCCAASFSASIGFENMRGSIAGRPALQEIMIGVEAEVNPPLETLMNVVFPLVWQCYHEPHPYTEETLEAAFGEMIEDPPTFHQTIEGHLSKLTNSLPKATEVVDAVAFMKKYAPPDVPLHKLLFSREKMF